MTPSRIAVAFALLAALCVLAIFFFPGLEGPYSVVHGPVTALLSVRAAARLRLVIRAGVSSVQIFVSSAFFASFLFARQSAALADDLSVYSPWCGSVAILRC